MKQTSAILLILIFLSCTDSKKENTPSSNVKESKERIKNEVKYDHIFLNLSPKMNNIQFEEKISNLLPNKKFILPINNYSFEFKIDKYSDKITLSYNDITTIVFTPKYGNNAEKRYLDFIKKDTNEEVIISNFIKLFKNKYPKQIKLLPIAKNLQGEYYNNQTRFGSKRDIYHYGFKEENYLIFQDSIKTIIIGYTNADNPRNLDRKALASITYSLKTNNLESDERESIKSIDLYDLAVELQEENEKLSPYQQALKYTAFEEQISKRKGVSLEINYMHNSDYYLLKNKIHKTNKDFNHKLKQKDSLLRQKLQKQNNNLDKI